MEKVYFYCSKSIHAISIKATSLFCICSFGQVLKLSFLTGLLSLSSSCHDLLELSLAITSASHPVLRVRFCFCFLFLFPPINKYFYWEITPTET